MTDQNPLNGHVREPGQEVNQLIAGLQDPDENVRKRSAYLLGWTGDPTAVSALEEVVKNKNENPIVRQNANDALARLNGHEEEPRGFKKLLKKLSQRSGK